MKLLSLLSLTILSLILASCSLAGNQTSTKTNVPPATKSLSDTPNTIISPSFTSTPIQTPIKDSPTRTPLPVLSAEESIERLIEMLHDNDGCLLPCLLGFTPGISTRQEFKNFLDQFVFAETSDILIRKYTDPDGNAARFFFRKETIYINVGISAKEVTQHSKVEYLGMGTFSQPVWEPFYSDVMKYYLLPQILVNYGRPSEIIILTYRDDRQRPDVTSYPFFLVLLYPNQGFYVKYEMERVTSGTNYLGCPSKSFVDVVVWPPDEDEIYERVVKPTINGEYLSDYKSLGEATSLTINDFYQTFSDPNNKDCIETPIEAWPNP